MGNVLKTLFVNLICWIILLWTATITMLYRFIVDIVLKIKFGDKYGGLFDRTDVFFCVPDVSKCCITTVLYIKSEKEVKLLDSFRKIFEEKVFAHPDSYPKLTSTKHLFGGYAFWLKKGCTSEDTIKPLPLPANAVFTEEYLKEVTAKITNDDHPKNGSILWDIHGSEVPLKHFAKGDIFYYPVVLRFSHAIADGTSLVALIIRLFGDESSQNYGEELFKKPFRRAPVKQKQQNIGEIIKLYMMTAFKTISIYLDLIFLSFGRITEMNQLRTNPDINTLHGSNYSGNKIVAWVTEDHTECIPLIKNIKKRANSKFISVVNTAISASMTNYFKKHCSIIPDCITGGISTILNFPAIDASQPIKLENKATAIFFDLHTTGKSKSLVESLHKVSRTMNQHSRYTDTVMSRCLMNMAGFFPFSLLKIFMGYQNNTFIITNVPGGSLVKLFGGCVLDRVVPICPHFSNIGITFALLSYDDRLNVGVLVDQTLNVTQEDVQQIADDIFYYIKLLDVETRKYYEE